MIETTETRDFQKSFCLTCGCADNCALAAGIGLMLKTWSGDMPEAFV
jgi:hypothetical protein